MTHMWNIFGRIRRRACPEILSLTEKGRQYQRELKDEWLAFVKTVQEIID